MPKPPGDDLFAESTMTFGEHLEELRSALLWAIGGLLGGCLVGLLMAPFVVEQIKVPLEKALEKFYVEQTKTGIDAEYDGTELPPKLKNLIEQGKWEFEEVYIERNEIEWLLAQLDSKHLVDEAEPTGHGQSDGTDDQNNSAGDNIDEAPRDKSRRLPTSDLVPTRIWKQLNPVVTSLSAQEPFIIFLKAALVAGLVMSSPWVFWHLWSFVGAGLFPHEKRYVYVFLPASLFLFLSGAALAFFVVFSPVLDFLFSFNRLMKIDPDPRISEWLGFVLFLPLGFGISFQLPLVMLFMERIGIFTVENYLEKWRVSVLIIFVISMVLTPADPISMLAMAGPLAVLYFLGIAICKWMPSIRRPMDMPASE